VLELE